MTKESEPKKKTRDMPRLGNLPLQFDFFLNPYSDVRFSTSCPDCSGKAKQRKLPLAIHVHDWPILFSALNQRSAWLHPGSGSSQFTDRPFDDYRRFDFRVGATELRAAIAAMRTRLPKLADASSRGTRDTIRA